MWKNNLKIALRNLAKQKVYTGINVIGLSVGIASCLLILLFIQNELSHDKFFNDHDRIYRMVLERIYPNHSTFYAIIPDSYASVAKDNFEEIEETTVAFGINDTNLTYRNQQEEEIQFDEAKMLAVDSSFLKIFDFKLLKGNREKALSQANQIVVTEEFALRYFNNEDPIGKTLRLGGDQEFIVSGLLQDVPDNSHFRFSALLSMYSFPFANRENFTGFSAYTYFKLNEGADPAVLEAKIPELVDIYAAGQIEQELGKSWEEYRNAGNGYRYFLQALPDIHLDSQYLELQMKVGGNIVSVYILIFVGFLILGIACINFMNLSTARSAERAKEVGVRKVMGSLKGQLMGQFLTEAFVISAFGILIALVIAKISIPFFNDLTERSLYLPLNLSWVAGLLLLTVLVALLAGLYPAFMLSSFNPVEVMKGKFTGNQKGNWIRNGLVVFQFWISIILIIGTLVIREQMNYMQNISLGFDKEQVLVVERGFSLGENLTTFLGEVRRLPEVQQAAATFAIPGRENSFFGVQFQPEGSSEILTTKSMVVFDQMPETLGLELLEGRWFSEETHDSLYVILNETAVKVMGIDQPLGSRLTQNQNRPEGNVSVTFTVIGVVKDFNFISLRDEITPLVIQSNEFFGGGVGQFVLARINPNQIPAAIAAVENKWRKIAPEQEFKFSFLNENLDRQYSSEQQTGKMFSIFSMLAILVSCIGLFALSAYITGLRTKEIGVRKVLGASVTSVVLMLSRDFTKMILLAFVLAGPVAWYLMEKWWLQNFAYRIEVSLVILAVSGLFVLVIAWITVSYQSLKAAIANPINSLKSE